MDISSDHRRSPPRWLLPLLLLLVLGGVVASRGLVERQTVAGGKEVGQASDPASEPVQGDAVSLTIDFGNGVVHRFAALAWSDGLTVEQLMAAAGDFRPGISYVQTGTGDAAFLAGIEGIANGDTEGRFWQYWVNDERADRSMGACQLDPGDRVLWKFAPEE